MDSLFEHSPEVINLAACEAGVRLHPGIEGARGGRKAWLIVQTRRPHPLCPPKSIRRKSSKGTQSRFALAQRDLGALACRDVQASAAISGKGARLIVHGLAADRIVVMLPIRLEDRELEVRKGPPRGEATFVFSPFRIG